MVCLLACLPSVYPAFTPALVAVRSLPLTLLAVPGLQLRLAGNALAVSGELGAAVSKYTEVREVQCVASFAAASFAAASFAAASFATAEVM